MRIRQRCRGATRGVDSRAGKVFIRINELVPVAAVATASTGHATPAAPVAELEEDPDDPIFYGWALKKTKSRLPEGFRLGEVVKGVQLITSPSKGHNACENCIKISRNEGLRILQAGGGSASGPATPNNQYPFGSICGRKKEDTD